MCEINESDLERGKFISMPVCVSVCACCAIWCDRFVVLAIIVVRFGVQSALYPSRPSSKSVCARVCVCACAKFRAPFQHVRIMPIARGEFMCFAHRIATKGANGNREPCANVLVVEISERRIHSNITCIKINHL